MREAGALLVEGRIDIAYVRPPAPYPEGVEARTAHCNAFIGALPAHSPLCASERISPAQLRGLLFVVPEQESGTFEVARHGRFRPQIVAQPDTLSAVLAHVSLGGVPPSCRTRSRNASRCRVWNIEESRESR